MGVPKCSLGSSISAAGPVTGDCVSSWSWALRPTAGSAMREWWSLLTSPRADGLDWVEAIFFAAS